MTDDLDAGLRDLINEETLLAHGARGVLDAAARLARLRGFPTVVLVHGDGTLALGNACPDGPHDCSS